MSVSLPTPEIVASEPFKPWNLGKLIGQKPPMKLREVWAIRIRLQISQPSPAIFGLRARSANHRFR